MARMRAHMCLGSPSCCAKTVGRHRGGAFRVFSVVHILEEVMCAGQWMLEHCMSLLSGVPAHPTDRGMNYTFHCIKSKSTLSSESPQATKVM